MKYHNYVPCRGGHLPSTDDVYMRAFIPMRNGVRSNIECG